MKMTDNRPSQGKAPMSDSPDSVRRAGGEDPRRYDAKIAIERVVKDHSVSGYNHNATSNQPANGGHENEMYMKMKDAEVERTPEIQPNGLLGMGPRGDRTSY